MNELKMWCKARGIAINDGQLNQFSEYKKNLLEWNQRINLTAITDDEGVWQKHFADSLTLLSFLPDVGREISLIDVGSGAGFPGLPIKIMRPDISVTLLDSLRKRIFFLEDTVNQLGLKDVTCVHARAEDFGKVKAAGRSFDICTSRAVARLDKLCGWCLPFLKPGGIFLAMKGPNVDEELEEALPIICKIGGEVLDVKYVEIVDGMMHSVVVVCYNE